ncbi:MAG TPA: ComF family protein [Burkholderiales bacterium]|nr:ComF family protein [Burkholderiales bacterium]
MRQLILNGRLKFDRIFFPQNCLLCNIAAGAHALCDACLADLPLHSEPACPVCAHPFPADAPSSDQHSEPGSGEICGACLKQPPRFKHCLAAYTYRFPVDKLIGAFKYHQQFSLVDILTAPLIARASGTKLPDALVAMPLHPRRLRERGFNQSLLLARRIARQLGLPLLETACQRVRDTAPQTTLSVDERRSNLRNAFICPGEIAGKRIAIIDDVMTSGSSLDNLSRALLKAGASEVECWVSARAALP